MSATCEVVVGDCLEVMAGLRAEGRRFDAIITDPPYCSGGITEAGKMTAAFQGLRSETIREGRERWFRGDAMTTEGFLWLMRSVGFAAADLLADEGSLLVFCDWRMAFRLAPAIESGGLGLRNLLVWDKGSAGLGWGFKPRHEIILQFSGARPKYHALDAHNVLDAKRIHASKREHPTEKPVGLLREMIRVVCAPGGAVLDPFAGSGSTGVAALAEGRGAVLIDRDPAWAETARRRCSSVAGPRAPLLAAMETP